MISNEGCNVTIAINLPDWFAWLLAALLVATMGVNIWHGLELRRYMRLRNEWERR